MLFKRFSEVKEKFSMNLIKIGVIGSVVAVLCCFTPVLVVLFGAVGLASIVAYLDYVLLPSLVFLIGLTVYTLVKRNRI